MAGGRLAPGRPFLFATSAPHRRSIASVCFGKAGRKGGERVSRDRVHMAEIGRLGGQRRAKNMGQRVNEEAKAS